MHWWDTLAAAWGFLIVSIGGSTLLAFLSTQIGIPIGILLLLLGILLIIRAYRNRDRLNRHSAVEIKPKGTIGGLVGHAGPGTKIINCHSSGKITIQGRPEEIDAGGLIGRADEGTEVRDSSTDAEIEYKQN